MIKEQKWQERVEKIISESLATLENAEGDPLAVFRRKIIETTAEDSGLQDLSDLRYLESLINEGVNE